MSQIFEQDNFLIEFKKMALVFSPASFFGKS